ncbi:unnamed protein product [Merluccius merluccius]
MGAGATRGKVEAAAVTWLSGGTRRSGRWQGPHAHIYTVHLDPALSSRWMKPSVSFLKAKLTDNTLDRHGHGSLLASKSVKRRRSVLPLVGGPDAQAPHLS